VRPTGNADAVRGTSLERQEELDELQSLLADLKDNVKRIPYQCPAYLKEMLRNLVDVDYRLYKLIKELATQGPSDPQTTLD